LCCWYLVGGDGHGESSKPKAVKGVIPAAQIKQFYRGMLSEIGEKSNGLNIGTRWVAGQGGTGTSSLDAAESL